MVNRNESINVANLEELAAFAQIFLSKIKDKYSAGSISGSKGSGGALVVGLSGDLGAGKTTFSQHIARLLGVHQVVNSPTFVIQKNYETNDEIFKKFAHIDAYRLENANEIESLKFKELLNQPETLIFIEWPEKIAEILSKETIMVSFESVSEHSRKISY